MTFPNIITILRILLTPVLVWKLLENHMVAALLVFVLAGATDLLDGLLARLLKQKSRLGSILDPIADKLLLVTSFALLAFIGIVPWWLAAVVILRDCMIVIGCIVLRFRRVQFEMRPVVVSKLTTAVELLTVLAMLAADMVPLPGWGYLTLFGLTVLFCVISGFQYFTIGMSLLRSSGHSAEAA
jgi:cardiolipin synthase (CMP-forming)